MERNKTNQRCGKMAASNSINLWITWWLKKILKKLFVPPSIFDRINWNRYGYSIWAISYYMYTYCVPIDVLMKDVVWTCNNSISCVWRNSSKYWLLILSIMGNDGNVVWMNVVVLFLIHYLTVHLLWQYHCLYNVLWFSCNKDQNIIPQFQ